MASDHILETRRAIVAALRADSGVVAFVPSSRIHGEQVPANPEWPFTLCGLPTEIPSRLSCFDNTELSVTVHGFARGPGMDQASALGNAIKRALDGVRIARGDLVLDFYFEQVQIIRDTAESADYHVLVRCRVEATEFK